jgi:hypothetical protein
MSDGQSGTTAETLHGRRVGARSPRGTSAIIPLDAVGRSPSAGITTTCTVLRKSGMETPLAPIAANRTLLPGSYGDNRRSSRPRARFDSGSAASSRVSPHNQMRPAANPPCRSVGESARRSAERDDRGRSVPSNPQELRTSPTTIRQNQGVPRMPTIKPIFVFLTMPLGVVPSKYLSFNERSAQLNLAAAIGHRCQDEPPNHKHAPGNMRPQPSMASFQPPNNHGLHLNQNRWRPSDRNIAILGWYMLFLADNNNVPSVARLLREKAWKIP